MFAQSGESEVEEFEVVEEVIDVVKEEESAAVISADETVEKGKKIIFDASLSVLPTNYDEVVYDWDFGDGNRDQGIDVLHSYSDPGEFDVVLTIQVDGDVYAERQMSVFSYRDVYLLITDQAGEQEKIDSMVSFARDRGLFVNVISSYGHASEFIVEEDLVQKLSESVSSFESTTEILIWTSGSTGLNVFSRFNQSFEDQSIFRDKDLIVITDQSFSTMGNIARGTFQTIEPNNMLLTRPEGLWVFLEDENFEDFVEGLSSRGVQYELVTEALELTPFNFMSVLVNFMVEKGVPSNSILLILMLPVIVTIVAFLKQVIGLTTMGVYTPSIITLSLIALDIKFGLFLFAVILFFGTITRMFLRRYRLLYIPRMAIVLSIVSLTILLTMFVGAYYDISQIVSISIFPMLIMSTMVEKFVNVQGERGLTKALVMIGSTLFVSVICYYFVEWTFLKTLIFGHPEVIFLFIFADIFLGRWTGLRLLEYVRFREIFRYSEEE